MVVRLLALERFEKNYLRVKYVMEIVKLPIRFLHDFSFHQHQIDHFEQLNISTNLHGFDFYGDF